MNYNSPYDLLQIAPDIIPDRQYLLNAKKLLLAKLELSNQTSISVHNTEYTKNDLDVIFEKLLGETHWEYHQRISRDKALKLFLKEGIWSSALFNETASDDDAFIAFIEPWYTSSYEKVFIDLIHRNKSVELKKFLSHRHLLSQEGFNSTQLNINLEIKKIALKIQGLIEDGLFFNKSGVASLKEYYQSKRIVCLNTLPDLFQDVRNDYAIALCKLFVAFNNNGNFLVEAASIARATPKLTLTLNAQSEASRIYAFYKRNYMFGGYGNGILKKTKALVTVIAAIVLMLIAPFVRHLSRAIMSDKDKPKHEVTSVATAKDPKNYDTHIDSLPLLDEADSEYYTKAHYVISPEIEQPELFSVAYIFYFQKAGYILDKKNVKLEPLTMPVEKYFTEAFPEACLGSSSSGSYSFKINNPLPGVFLAFIVTPKGQYYVNLIPANSNQVIHMKEDQVKIHLVGGATLSSAKWYVTNKEQLKLLPVFEEYNVNRENYTVWSDFISFKDAPNSPSPGVAATLEYTIITADAGKSTINIRNKVKVDKK